MTCQTSGSPGSVYGPVYSAQTSSWTNVRAFQVTVSNGPNFLFGNFGMHEPISSSLMRDASGGHLQAMSYASAMEEAFWDPGYRRCYFDGINPDPGVEAAPATQPEPGRAPTRAHTFGQLNLEIARRAHGQYGSGYLDVHPEEGVNLFHGAAIDNVGVYLRTDFNPRMLHVASLPLGYDPATSAVVSFEHLGMQAFLQDLRASLPADAPIATNGVPISGILGQDVDYFINEMIPIRRNGVTIDKIYDESLARKLRLIDRIRMVANQRPVTLMAVLDRADDDRLIIDEIREYFPLYTAKGIYINIDRYGRDPQKYFWSDQPSDPAVLEAYKRHLDTVYALNVAGWEPETFAKPVDPHGQAVPGVLVERFGDELLTLYNADQRANRFDLALDWRRVGLPTAPARIIDRETGATLPFNVSGELLIVPGLELAANAVQVIEIH